MYAFDCVYMFMYVYVCMRMHVNLYEPYLKHYRIDGWPIIHRRLQGSVHRLESCGTSSPYLTILK